MKASVKSSLSRVVLHLFRDRVRSNGTVESQCKSRLLESSLMLHLLVRLGLLSEAPKGLVRYVASEGRNGADEVSRAFADNVLKRDIDPLVETFHYKSVSFDDYRHHTRSRKDLYFHILMAEMGCLPYKEISPENFSYDSGHQTWTRIILCALKVIYFSDTHRHELIDERDLAVLKEALGDTYLYEYNIFCSALAILALSKQTHTKDFARYAALELSAKGRDDGGFPFFACEIDVFVASLAGIALKMATDVIGYPAAYQDGSDVRKIGDFIADQQHATGGWSYARNINQTDVDDTSYSTIFLSLLNDGRYDLHLKRALCFLVNMQNHDGGFPTYLTGQCSEAAMTAGAIEAISRTINSLGMNDQVVTQCIVKAVDFLFEMQEPDGTFERSWSLAETNALFRVLSAMDRAAPLLGPDNRCISFREKFSYVEKLINGFLAKSMNHDGGFGHTPGSPSDVISTAYALLCRRDSNASLLQPALEYLITHQHEDGSFHAISDQLGPRPFVWTVEAMPSIMCTMALARYLTPPVLQAAGEERLSC